MVAQHHCSRRRRAGPPEHSRASGKSQRDRKERQPAACLLAGMIKQFLRDVDWGELDYLIVDTPPGTSDEHLSAVQYLAGAHIDGAVLITTPQVSEAGACQEPSPWLRSTPCLASAEPWRFARALSADQGAFHRGEGGGGRFVCRLNKSGSESPFNFPSRSQ